MNIIYKLNELDFSPGIRAEYINENFVLIKRWIDAERLRVGGWGIVEGFELSKNLEQFAVTVSKGIIINEYGEELRVDENTFKIGPPSYRELTEEFTVDANGVVELSFCPYSNDEKHTITYDGVKYKYLSELEFSVYDKDKGMNLSKNHIRNISQNILIVNKDFAGDKLLIKYFYANDRIDGVLLKKDGSEYIYEMGIISTSPSQHVIKDYMDNGYYLIGFCYWDVGDTVDVRFIETGRSYRPVYVDKNNLLYLNGSLYTGNKFIYFAEPEFPEENTLWYDVENEILYIWRPDPDKEGAYAWKAVNDLSRFHREVSLFLPEDNPEDMQTFTFEDRPELRFVPGKHQLRIIIDQIEIMEDQFEELYDASIIDLNNMTGYGFRLIEPLDEPRVVEVHVDHSLNTAGHTEDLFEKIACFIYEDNISEENKLENNFYSLKADYSYGDYQLEIWRNGVKLNRGIDFWEAVVRDNGPTQAGEHGQLTNVVYIGNKNANDKITYKITRHMATYDNFKKYVEGWNERFDNVEADNSELSRKLDLMDTGVSLRLNSLEKKASTAENDISNLKKDYISKTEKIVAEDLSDVLKAKIFAGAEYFSTNIEEVFTLENTKTSDYLSISYIKDDSSLILRRNIDYTVTQQSNDVQVVITNDTVLDNAGWGELYIELIRFGI